MSGLNESGGVVCPYLGIRGDQATHFAFPERTHRCYAKGVPVGIQLGFQAESCLGGRFADCSRYRTADSPPPAWWQPPVPLVTAKPTKKAVKARIIANPDEDPRRRLGRMVAILAAGATLAAVILFGPQLLAAVSRPAPSPVAGTTPSPAQPTATPTQAASSTPTASPSPTLTPSPTPTASPTATPSPTPTPLVHVVAEGETLRSVARLYSVPLAELIELNRLTNPDLIRVGQHLLIPVR